MRQQQQLHNPDAQNHSFSTGTQHNQLTDGRTLARYGSLTSSDALFDALFLDSTVNNRRPTGSDTRVVGSGEIDGRARWSPYAHSRCRTVKSVTFSLFAFPVTDVLSANGSHWEILCWYWLWNPRKNAVKCGKPKMCVWKKMIVDKIPIMFLKFSSKWRFTQWFSKAFSICFTNRKNVTFLDFLHHKRNKAVIVLAQKMSHKIKSQNNAWPREKWVRRKFFCHFTRDKNGYLRRVSLEKNVNLVVLPNHQENHEIARFHSRNLKLLENFTLL